MTGTWKRNRKIEDGVTVGRLPPHGFARAREKASKLKLRHSTIYEDEQRQNRVASDRPIHFFKDLSIPNASPWKREL